MDVETLGEFVKRMRTAKGLSQASLGRLIHVDGQTISNLESGRTRTLKLKNLVGLPAALGTTMEELQRVAEGVKPHTVAIELPRPIYDSIARRAAHEGTPDVVAFLARIATEKTYVIEHLDGPNAITPPDRIAAAPAETRPTAPHRRAKARS